MAGSEDQDQEPVTQYTIFLQPEAEEEIIDAFRYYDDKAEGLGAEFVRAIDACLASIERNPRAYAVVYKEARRALLRRFPYSLFYLIDEAKISIVACSHASRDPKHWQRHT